MVLVKRKVKVCILLVLLFIVLISLTKHYNSDDWFENNKSSKEHLLSPTSPVISYIRDGSTTPYVRAHQNPILPNLAPLDWLESLRRNNNLSDDKTSSDTVLLYDGFEWWNESLQTLKDCPVSCKFVESVTEESPYNATYSAIILVRDMFHSFIIDETELLNPNTKIIYYTLEAPVSTYALHITPNAMLASYWRGSDFWTPYTKWKTTPGITNTKTIPLKNHAAGKTRQVATVVSNCITRNDREWYVSDLNKHIRVDIFGQCGNNSCEQSSNSICFSHLSKTYKFYLAFENTNCRDYITEKYFRSILELDIIPVVMGPPKADYEALVPKRSFIHIDDFQSPAKLAEYLLLLDKDDKAYSEYFRWKYEAKGQVGQTHFLCEVCSMVKLSHYYPIRTRLRNGFQWVSENEELCLPNGHWNWNVWE